MANVLTVRTYEKNNRGMPRFSFASGAVVHLSSVAFSRL